MHAAATGARRTRSAASRIQRLLIPGCASWHGTGYTLACGANKTPRLLGVANLRASPAPAAVRAARPAAPATRAGEECGERVQGEGCAVE